MKRMKVTLVDKIDSEDESKMKNGTVVRLADLDGSKKYDFQVRIPGVVLHSMTPKPIDYLEHILKRSVDYARSLGTEIRKVYVSPEIIPSSSQASSNLTPGTQRQQA